MHWNLSGNQYKSVASIMKQHFGDCVQFASAYKIGKGRPLMEIGWLRKQLSHHYEALEGENNSYDDNDKALAADIHLL